MLVLEALEQVVPLRGFEPLTPSLRMINRLVCEVLIESIKVLKTVKFYPYLFAIFRQCLTLNDT